MAEKKDILSLTYNELENIVVSELAMPRFRAAQIYEWAHKGESIDQMSNLSKKDREKVDNALFIALPSIAEKYVSAIDGTVKYLFELADGNFIESVVMQYEHGLSICVS